LEDWFESLTNPREPVEMGTMWLSVYDSRREAEDAAALAFAQLPAARRAELLATEVLT
jgi:hypothetical protein